MSYLYTQVSASDFADLFRQCGRESQFSYRAKIALFNYLNDLALDTGSPIEIDVVALCCEWSEYSGATVAAQECGYVQDEEDEEDEEDEKDEEMFEYLREKTQIIEFAGGILVQDF